MDDNSILWQAGETSIRLVPFSGPWDLSSIETSVEVDSGVFRGTFLTYIDLEDLNRARDTLQSVYDHIGETTERDFYLGEREIDMTFRPTALGALEIEVEVIPHIGLDPTLRFTMQADQSYLPTWIASVDRAFREWPAIGLPNPDQV
jgi:hypothetical protein